MPGDRWRGMIQTANRNYQCKIYCQQKVDQSICCYLSFNPSPIPSLSGGQTFLLWLWWYVCVFRKTQMQPTEFIFIVGIYLVSATITLHWKAKTELKLGIGYFPFSQQSLISWNSLSNIRMLQNFPLPLLIWEESNLQSYTTTIWAMLITSMARCMWRCKKLLLTLFYSAPFSL